jgi:uncharacterized Tic20 family protein
MHLVKIRSIWLILVTLLLIAGPAVACPMCKDSIPNSDAAQAGSLPSGFNFSVYYMLVSFLVVLSLVATVIVRAIRSADRQIQTPPAPQPAP